MQWHITLLVKYNVLYFTLKSEVIDLGFAVVHMQKIKSGAVGGIQSHINREHQPKSNPDVDMTRSKDNYDIVSCSNYQRTIKERIAELVVSNKAVRKDAVVCCNFIITSDNQTMEELGADKRKEFFEDSVKWFADRYGADRILNAIVHCDETTDHLHLGVLPITEDGRLSAKAIFTKTELKSIQTEFARDVGSKYGLERGVEGSERTHLSEIEYKIQEATKLVNDICFDAQIVQEEVAESKQELESVLQEISHLQERRHALEGEIAIMECKVAELPLLYEKINDAEDTLSAMDKAIKKKDEDGRALRGSEWFSLVRQYKNEVKEDRKQSLLVKFAEKIINEFPAINELWQRFQLENSRDRQKTKKFENVKE